VKKLFVVALAALLMLAFRGAAERGRPGEREVRLCASRGSGMLESQRAVVVMRGRVPSCDEDREATEIFLRVDHWLDKLRPPLAPGFVRLELGGALEARPELGTLVLSRTGSSDGVVLHELAHLAAHGSRPRARAARRLAAAIDEGVADYFAAALTGSPRIGPPDGRVRDLSELPPFSDAEWALLALDAFEPHRFGHRLAALLWQAEPFAGALLEDFVTCLASSALDGAETPGALLGALERSCPARSQPRIAALLRSYAPEELFP
jgi:hypothetical protein